MSQSTKEFTETIVQQYMNGSMAHDLMGTLAKLFEEKYGDEIEEKIQDLAGDEDPEVDLNVNTKEVIQNVFHQVFQNTVVRNIAEDAVEDPMHYIRLFDFEM